MSKKAWIIFASICVVVLVGLVVVSNKNRVNVDHVDKNAIQTASQQSGNIADHVVGKADSKVILMEYGDFQCPGCGKAYPIIKATAEKYKDQVAFVFRNLPLSSLHPNALAAAAAAEAAGLQGKYWEMHDVLYGAQSEWEQLSTSTRLDHFASYAKDLGLDVDKFKTDFASRNVNAKIAFDQAVFAKTGLEKATPTIVLNGKQVAQDTWNDQAKLDAAVADAMKANGLTLPDTTKQ